MPTIKELTNIRATHVSYVRKGANKKEFFLTKQDVSSKEQDVSSMKQDDAPPDFEKEFGVFVSKDDADKKLVYGVVYEPDAVDTQNEFARAEEIEKAAHSFLADCRNIDLQHDFQPGVGTVVESYVAPADFKIGEQNSSADGRMIKKGSWVLVTKASDEVWEDIKKGVITGYSMAGKALKTPVEGAAKMEKGAFGESEDVKGFFNAMKEFFASVRAKKADDTDAADIGAKKYDEGEYENMSNTELKELVAAIVDEAVKPLGDRLDALEQQNPPKTADAAGDAVEPGGGIAAVIKSALEEAVKPLGDRISAIEKSRGVSRQEQEKLVKNAAGTSVFAGINV